MEHTTQTDIEIGGNEMDVGHDERSLIIDLGPWRLIFDMHLSPWLMPFFLSDDDGQAVYDLPFVSRGILLRKCLMMYYTNYSSIYYIYIICIFTNKKK